MDKAREQTDKLLAKMEHKVEDIYKTATKEISENWDAYMKSHAPKLEAAHTALQEAMKSGDAEAIAKAKNAYERTARNITLNNDRFKAMVDETTEKLAHTNEIALEYVNGNMAKIYTMNYNAFADQKIAGYSFSLVNEQAITTLATIDKTLLPKRKLDIPKDKRWNEKKINSQMTQGILQGESIPKMAARLQTVTDMNRVSAIRNARTMVTAAENKGRQDSFVKATEDGVIMTRVWVATHDERTRAWHADLDGVRVAVDEPWENEYGEIMEPGDPDADPANTYNCRCGMRAQIKGFKWNENAADKGEDEKPISDIDQVSHTTNMDSYNQLMQSVEANDISYNEVKELPTTLSTNEIITKIAGGDETTGSCASLSFSYIANKCGLDVTDFRGGKSTNMFARTGNIKSVMNTANAEIIEKQVTKELKGVLDVIKEIPYGKEYVLSAGKHMTIIRRVEGVGFEYLELQSPTKNGWMKLKDANTLQKRFGLTKSERTVYGEKLKSKILLADVDSFQPTAEFKEILGYFNTATDAQKKGALGYAK